MAADSRALDVDYTNCTLSKATEFICSVLTCPWCADPLETARTFPCGHHTCGECAETMINEDDCCCVCNTPYHIRDARESHMLNELALLAGKLRDASRELGEVLGCRAAAQAAGGGGGGGGDGSDSAGSKRAALAISAAPPPAAAQGAAAVADTLEEGPAAAAAHGRDAKAPTPLPPPAAPNAMPPPPPRAQLRARAPPPKVAPPLLPAAPPFGAPPPRVGGAQRAASAPLVLCSSNLDDEGRRLLRRALKLLSNDKGRAMEVEDFDAAIVTHVVTRCVGGGGGGSGGAVCKRTLKYAQGVLAGCWVVSDGWLAACVAEGARVPEAPFEICGDSAVPQGGAPRKAREAAARGAPPLWAGLFFCLLEPLTPLRRDDAAALLAVGGGGVLPEGAPFGGGGARGAGGRASPRPLFVVLSMQPKHWAAESTAAATASAAGGRGGAASAPRSALELARSQCRDANIQAVDQLWLLDCVSHYKQLNPKEYTWDSVNWDE